MKALGRFGNNRDEKLPASFRESYVQLMDRYVRYRDTHRYDTKSPKEYV